MVVCSNLIANSDYGDKQKSGEDYPYFAFGGARTA